MHTMKEACEETGMAYETLKFYCNQGLLPNVKRDKNNRRVFSDHDMAWLKSLVCLKNCDMSLTEMKEYLELCLGGEPTIPQRKLLLAAKQQELKKKLASVQEAIAQRSAKGERLAGFIRTLAAQKEPVAEFDERLWGAMVDYVTVGVDKRLTVVFRDGTGV